LNILRQKFEVKHYSLLDSPNSLKYNFKNIDDYWYLWTEHPDAGDNIFCGSTTKREDGFSGSTINFTLTDGSIVKLLGPWHTSSSHLLSATGVDLRNKHYTRCVVGLERKYNYPNSIIEHVIYEDVDWMISDLNRGDYLAFRLMQEVNRRITYFNQSSGGSILRTTNIDDKMKKYYNLDILTEECKEWVENKIKELNLCL